MTDLADTTPGAERPRSYNGGYMKAGGEAEEIVFAWLRRKPWVVELVDERLNPHCQENGIDFRVCSQSGNWSAGEIKSDRHLGRTGNFLFELHRINLTAAPEHQFVQGWSVRSKAHRLCVYSPYTGYIHIVKMQEYRRAFLQAVAAGDCRFDLVPTDAIKRTVNVLFPVRYVVAMPSYGEVEP